MVDHIAPLLAALFVSHAVAFDTATMTFTLSQTPTFTVSPTQSATTTLSVSPTFTFSPTASFTATKSRSWTLTLPTATASESATLRSPTATFTATLPTATRTVSVSQSNSVTLSYISRTQTLSLPPVCELATSDADCQTRVGCSWNAGSNSCGRFCGNINSTQTCDAMVQCQWRSASGCAPLCSQERTVEDCYRLRGCSFLKGACAPSCELLDEATCSLDANDNLCEWRTSITPSKCNTKCSNLENKASCDQNYDCLWGEDQDCNFAAPDTDDDDSCWGFSNLVNFKCPLIYLAMAFVCCILLGLFFLCRKSAQPQEEAPYKQAFEEPAAEHDLEATQALAQNEYPEKVEYAEYKSPEPTTHAEPPAHITLSPEQPRVTRPSVYGMQAQSSYEATPAPQGPMIPELFDKLPDEEQGRDMSPKRSATEVPATELVHAQFNNPQATFVAPPTTYDMSPQLPPAGRGYPQSIGYAAEAPPSSLFMVI